MPDRIHAQGHTIYLSPCPSVYIGKSKLSIHPATPSTQPPVSVCSVVLLTPTALSSKIPPVIDPFISLTANGRARERNDGEALIRTLNYQS